MDFAIIVLLVVALGFVVVDNYFLDEDTEFVAEAPVAPDAEVPSSEPEPAPAVAEQREVLPNSVAVLPFENLSLDPENAFFAAGIHEETLNQLTKLHNLSVISRTSVLRYEDSDLSIPEIASELSVGAVMEGSVRYADDKVRITAQLIDAATDEHLWSEVYERDFADIFAIQSDIAMNIANALEAEFSLEEQASIEKIPTESPEAYRYFLAALQEFAPNRGSVRIEYLNRAIEADPSFARAYAARGWAQARQALGDTESQEEFEALVANAERLALADINKAFEIDSDLAYAYLALAYIHENNWRGAEAQDAYGRAYEISPNDPGVLTNYASFLSNSGDHAEAVRLAERRRELDPTGGIASLGAILWGAGELERSVEVFRDYLTFRPGNNNANRLLANYEWQNGNLDAAREHMEALEVHAWNSNNLTRAATVISQYSQYGFAEDTERLLAVFDEKAETNRVSPAANFEIQMALGDEEQALYWLERIVEEQQPYQGTPVIVTLKQNALHNPVLEKPEFVELRNQLGFTDL